MVETEDLLWVLELRRLSSDFASRDVRAPRECDDPLFLFLGQRRKSVVVYSYSRSGGRTDYAVWLGVFSAVCLCESDYFALRCASYPSYEPLDCRHTACVISKYLE